MSAISRWATWVDEMAECPLDRSEYQAALECRDEAAEHAEVFGDEGDRERLDAADAAFQSLTVEVEATPFKGTGGGWWWNRVPADEDARRYMER